jgi:hypothetical protein
MYEQIITGKTFISASYKCKTNDNTSENKWGISLLALPMKEEGNIKLNLWAQNNTLNKAISG